MTMGDVLGILLDCAWLTAGGLLVRAALIARRPPRQSRLFVASGLGAMTCLAEMVLAISPSSNPTAGLVALGMVLATLVAFIAAGSQSPSEVPGALVGFVLVLVVVGPLLAHAFAGGGTSHDEPGLAQGVASHHIVA